MVLIVAALTLYRYSNEEVGLFGRKRSTVGSTGLGVVGMTIATSAHTHGTSYATRGYADEDYLYDSPHCELEITRPVMAAPPTEVMVFGAETVLVKEKSRWPSSEDEIVRVAITVILVALVTIMVLAAAAILTMG
jgi:hypothetical protein